MTTVDDVAARLGRLLTVDETERASGILDEASALVSGYLGTAYDADHTAVVVVESRIAARALTAGVAAGVQSRQESAGPMSQQTTMTAEASSSGGVWLSKTDKQMLAGLRPSMVSAPISTERYA